MTKRIVALLTALLLMCIACVTASAESSAYCRDFEELLSDSKAKTLSKRAEKLTEEYDCFVQIITYDNDDVPSLEYAADNILDSIQGEYRGGVLLIVSDSMREYTISAGDFGEEALTESGRKYIEKKIVPHLKDGDYEAAFEEFLDITEKYLEHYDSTGRVYIPFSFTWVLWALGIGIVIAFITVFIMKGQLKSVRYQSAAGNYLVDGSFNLTLQRDIYLYSTVKRVAKPKQNSSSSGGSSGGSRGHTSGSF